jgi:hypothetical protein
MYCDYGDSPVKNYATYFFCTNNRDSIRIEDGDRRYFCLNVSSAKKQNIEYFGNLVEAVNAPGFYDHLLSYFLRMDTTSLNIHIPPMTDLKRDMMEASLSYPEQFIRRCPWSNALMWESFDAVWRKYIDWLDDRSIDSLKYAGARNKFYERVSDFVEKRRYHGLTQYRPSQSLIEYWKENGFDEDQEEKEREGDRDDTQNPVLYDSGSGSGDGSGSGSGDDI